MNTIQYTYFLTFFGNYDSVWFVSFKNKDLKEIKNACCNGVDVELTPYRETLIYNHINKKNLWHRIESE